ncbi:hypothetical protein [Acaryochloris sp. IP29b_bin.148]|uniref:hypothetical protein n=1 Tax=Acaryochloris sp. IP29b_bin.148 TaxID=2969218 RepID=UPI002639AD25|nr:hypothetical protein [Acaryochloris sp. IP29b_bin.148]
MSLLGQNWWNGWSNVGNKPLQPPVKQALSCIRQEQSGWTDFFIGSVRSAHSPHQSILDGSAKVGLHYRKQDLGQISRMDCPSVDIPDYLWRSLQEQYWL